MNKRIARLWSAVLSLAILTTGGLTGPEDANADSTPAAYKFDFGSGPVEPGYLGVHASELYSTFKGYGFQTPQFMANVAASGTGAGSDAVQFLQSGTQSSNTFNVDLHNGLYQVQVMLGDTSRASVAAEGVYQIINMTGNQATDSFLMPIKDGQLNLLVTAGKAGTPFTLASLEITKISSSVVMPRTVWIGGDSTVANYYPKESDELVGWGQIMPELVNPDVFTVRNMASAGQVAKGFLEGGQLEAILKYLKPGDYFLFEMGINDKKAYSEADFKGYMRTIVQAAKAKGATIVLVTPQGRSIDWTTEGTAVVHYAEDSWYRHSTIALSQEEGVPLVDLNTLSSSYFTSIGPDETLLLYKTSDYLHFNRKGATVLARLVVEDLRRQGMNGFTN